MSAALKNSLMISAILLITALPLLTIKPPVPESGGQRVELFTGADTQAEGLIRQIQPDYRPWFSSIFTPPSGEIEGLLFALQAAIGAGVIGYYAGYVRGRKSTERPSAAKDHARAH